MKSRICLNDEHVQNTFKKWSPQLNRKLCVLRIIQGDQTPGIELVLQEGK